jgi:hypothetical protein
MKRARHRESYGVRSDAEFMTLADLQGQILCLPAVLTLGRVRSTHLERVIWRRNDLACRSLVHTDVAEWARTDNRKQEGI